LKSQKFTLFVEDGSVSVIDPAHLPLSYTKKDLYLKAEKKLDNAKGRFNLTEVTAVAAKQ
jgi:hypothetical protein